jgi:hypothetical protein
MKTNNTPHIPKSANEPLAASGISSLPAAPAPFRIVLISFLAAGVGLLAGIVAYIRGFFVICTDT